jgi:L-alanine-DL-glutamate epimerase-like enolase superfamily enzyme
MTTMLRRDLLLTGASVPLRPLAAATASPIRRVEVIRYQGPRSAAEHLEIEAAGGVVGVFGPLGWNLPAQLATDMPKIREHLLGRDASDRRIEFESLWRALYPGRSLEAYARGFDPLTGVGVWGTTRGGRQTPTGLKIMALSAVDNALWDLRGKLLGRPVCRLIGRATRPRLEVYSRVGEGKDLAQARRQARERFDRGQKHQKWYFVYGPKDGAQGLRANLELVRILREELGPAPVLMFDNHSMRFEIGPEWVVELARRMLPYRPFWLEEPTAPEDLEGYARIKGETGITIAAGEHHFTRWQIQPLLER